jgi:hypothetical protein
MKNDKIDEKVLNSIYKDLEKEMGLNSKPILERNKKIMTGSLNKKVADNDLLTLMTKRLNVVENQLAESNIQIKNLLQENINLKSELDAIKQGRCLQCEEYENKLKNGEPSEKLPKRIDIAELIKKIEEMNIDIMEENDHATFEKGKDNVFKIKHLRIELKIFFFKNGLAIENYSFYEYGSKEAKKILKDILDGYTPYILKSEYPNGVILKVENNVQNDYNKQSNKFKNDKITAEEFVNKFPEKYIKNGEIHNLKQGIEKHLIYKINPEDGFDEDEYNLYKDATDDTICKLKIQVELLNKVLTINVLKTDNFTNLFDFLKKKINSSVNIQFLKIKDIQTYLIYSTYPFKKYEYNECKTFEECGLFPSYFLTFADKNKFNK